MEKEQEKRDEGQLCWELSTPIRTGYTDRTRMNSVPGGRPLPACLGSVIGTLHCAICTIKLSQCLVCKMETIPTSCDLWWVGHTIPPPYKQLLRDLAAPHCSRTCKLHSLL